MSETTVHHTAADVAKAIAAACVDRGITIATAESLTGGQIAAALTAAPDSADWYRGGVVAYCPEVKFEVLGVTPGPVVTAETARQMAESVVSLMGAEFSTAVTGVGGPGPDEGQPAGTVYLATSHRGTEAKVALHRFAGEPLEVLEQTVIAALRSLLQRIEGAVR